MQIALVVAGPYPAFRGSQVLVRHLEVGLRERGHAVHLVTYGSWLASRPGLHPARVVLDVVLVARLWRLVAREGIQVIHAHNYEAAIAGLIVARATGRPLVYHGHSALEEELPTYAGGQVMRRVLAGLGRRLDAGIPPRADFCIAVSDQLGDVLRRAGVADDGLACIAPANAPHEAGSVPAEALGSLVCYAGNLDRYQNLEFLLESFAMVRARVPDSRLVIVTHEGGRAEADRLASRGLGIGVEVVCAPSYDDVHRQLEAAAVAVCPRVERSGFPMKLLNYMAAGKAIVASAGSAKGLRDGVTGRLVPDGDAGAFADAIVELLSDPAARRRLGSAARQAVESRGTWEHVFDRLEAIYERVLARRAPELMPVACSEGPA
jgi:1,2-diacylglycerol 3-alpha-glucosyltransferase